MLMPGKSNNNMRIISSTMTGRNSFWICLLICCLCNSLGLHCLAQVAEAMPFEYLDEQDDLNYDLDTAQSQAKYDAHLLAQQMVSDAELERNPDNKAALGNEHGEVEDMEPHSRAASCFTNGRKYTHGQKVPRMDPCEVCLCMDGEIFCWWEKCDKANVNMAASDYSDPYRYETTTKKSAKPHKASRKLGKRHKHHKNQKNFNDYQVYHSHKQADYEKEKTKQQKQKSGNNYNKIKQHKHKHEQQHQKLELMKAPTETISHQAEQQKAAAAAALVNETPREMHYQEQQSQRQQPAELQKQQQQPQYKQQSESMQHRQQHLHAHQPHSSSKILNFPENLPALLYYDYKTEEHEHHQHQHHQQHLLHQQALALQRQRQQQTPGPVATFTSAQLVRQRAEPAAAVELNSEVGADKNFDEAQTDSDILPEPPTKRPKATWTTKAATATATATPGTVKALMTSSLASTTTSSPVAMLQTIAAPATQQTPADNKIELQPELVVVATTHTNANEVEELDDAFHRWLTSTELNVDSDNTNTADIDDSLPATAAVEQETLPSTIIDDVGITNKSNNNNSNASNDSNTGADADAKSMGFHKAGHGNNADNADADADADAVFFRSSYNDYSSEFNGSVVNIDITLTAVDVHPQRLQPEQQPVAAHVPGKPARTDLIANANKTPDARATTTTTTAATSSSSAAATTTTSIPRMGSNPHAVPPYTLTTIITTTPLAPNRMCNVLGKLYKIGDILPQDTGNCLQCICTDAVTPDELPSVTCSPHNCPPLVLPDLFDATGY